MLDVKFRVIKRGKQGNTFVRKLKCMHLPNYISHIKVRCLSLYVIRL